MNLNTVDVTAVRQEQDWRTHTKLTVTPISEKAPQRSHERNDYSTALKQNKSYALVERREVTPLQSEYEFFSNEEQPTFKNWQTTSHIPADDMNANRITLLARKYAMSNMPPEDSARLDILTQRLRNMTSGVTEQDLTIMDDVTKQIDSANKLISRIQNDY